MMVRVHFQPGALFRLLRVPLYEFTDNWLDGSSVIGGEIHAVNERLRNCRSYQEMISVVEEYLSMKVKKVRETEYPLDRVACSIFENPSRFSLDTLAKEACLCHRQFNRKFTERMGVGPKLYSRVVRFYKAYQYKEKHTDEDWLTIALLFGYSDYQHMVKDFKEFSHLTPNLWINQDNQSPERILQLE
jgi:AraC-like DNA-binding protein